MRALKRGQGAMEMAGVRAHASGPDRAPAGERLGRSRGQWSPGRSRLWVRPRNGAASGAPLTRPCLCVCSLAGRHGELFGGRGAERGGPTFPAAFG